MKKVIGSLCAVAVMFTLAYAGENYFHSIKAEFGGFASGLGVGKSEASAGYVLDVQGAALITGVPTIVGSPVITGSPDITGNPTVVGSITISTSATTVYDCKDYGAVASLPTSGVSECSKAFLVSNHKLYVATAAASVSGCVSGNCFVAVH